MTVAINPQVIRWFEKRGISGETVIRLGIYSARVAENGEHPAVEPHQAGNIIVFPYIDRDGEPECGAKYRAANKHFWQKPSGRKTFFNALVLDDPALREGSSALVITEGEMDTAAVVEAGYPFVLSVPDGAPPARDSQGKLIAVPEGTSDIDPAQDDKFSYIFGNWDRLAKIKRIIIAADADEPGQRLAAELVRRLGRVRCSFLTYPEGCKDFNDVLMTYGPAEVVRIIHAAKPYPVSGIYRLSEFPKEPDLLPLTTGWARLDDHLKVFQPAFMVITGTANSGKSSWANQLVANLAFLHGWACGIASFEMRVRPFVTDTLEAAYRYLARNEDGLSDWLESRFCFIAPDADDDSSHDIEWLISRAEAAVIRHGIRVLLVDPWNEIDHSKRPDESTSDYTGRAIKALKSFGRRFGCLVIVVAHPTKEGARKNPDDISLYDISESAHFANKADLGVIIRRLGNSEADSLTSVTIKKVRYEPHTGSPGKIELSFDRETRIFSE